MRTLVRVALGLLGCCFFTVSSPGFTSLYVFGDGACTTTRDTNDGNPPEWYYGPRYCNGRVWVEALAQWQGIPYDSNKTVAYFGHDSSNLVASVNNFTAPADGSNALFAVWVSDADFVYDLNHISPPYSSNNAAFAPWTNAINRSLSNHVKAISNLWVKGMRTLVIPSAVDITKSPSYSALATTNKNFVRARVIDFNNRFNTALGQLKTNCPGLTAYSPDVFTLLDSLVAFPANYGLTNSTSDVLDDFLNAVPQGDISFNGPGTNYLFWDFIHPTAKVQAIIADVSQKFLPQPLITNIAAFAGSNRLDLANVPVGRTGVVERSAGFTGWTAAAAVNSTNRIQPVFVTASDPLQFYRLRFPFVWTWP